MDQDVTHKPALSQRAIWMISGSVLVGVSLYLAGIIITDIHVVVDASSRISFSVWCLLLLTSLVNYALRFVRWDMMLRIMEKQLPFWKHAIFYLAGFALSTTPGKAGEAIRSVYLTRYHVKVEESVSVLFVERFMDLISITLLAILASSALTNSGIVYVVSVMMILGLVGVVVSPIPRWVQKRWIDGRSMTLLRSFGQKIIHLLQISHALLTHKIFLYGNLIGLIAWASEGIGFYILCQVLGFDISFTMAMGIYGASMLIGALSFLPGGIGTTEAAMAAMLIGLGVSPPEAVIATIICRLVTLWFAVILGLMALGGATRIKVGDA